MQLSDLKTILTRLEESEENITEFDESWSQGRSAYGGIATAFAVTGMRKLLASPKPLRSLMVSFIAPVPPGEVKVDAQIQCNLRRPVVFAGHGSLRQSEGRPKSCSGQRL